MRTIYFGAFIIGVLAQADHRALMEYKEATAAVIMHKDLAGVAQLP